MPGSSSRRVAAMLGAALLIVALLPAAVAAAGPATQLAFTIQPGGGTGGTSFGTQPVVTVQDAGGNTVTADTSAVTLSITSGTGTTGAVLSGTFTVNAVNGVATFSGLSINLAGTGYKLTAADGSLTTVDNTAFDIMVGPAAQIHLWWMCNGSCSPTWGAGIPFSMQPGVEVRDAGGNTVTADNTTGTTLSLSGGSGNLTCTGGLTKTVTAGWAYFSGCSVDMVGDYTLTATSSPQGWTYSRTFTVTGPGTPAQLAFTAYPPATTYASLGTIKVAVEDAFGTVVTTDTSSLGLQLWYDNGYQQATLNCTGGTTQTAVSGVATFTGCVAPGPGTGYFLEAYPVDGHFYGDSPLFTVINPPPPPPAPTTPQIALSVSASPTSLSGSGSVTYTYSVTNPGPVALSGVSVSDTTCSPATYVSGDTNKDGLLQPGETWTYTCTTALAATTTDAAKATGTGNGTSVSATGGATVTVTTPPALTLVTLTDGIAPGVNRSTTGFGTTSIVVAPNGYITLLARTDPNLAGSLVQIWVKSKTADWHPLTLRQVAADGTVHYFARVSGWTGYWVKFPGDTTHAPAVSHGRIATTKS